MTHIIDQKPLLSVFNYDSPVGQSNSGNRWEESYHSDQNVIAYNEL